MASYAPSSRAFGIYSGVQKICVFVRDKYGPLRFYRLMSTVAYVPSSRALRICSWLQEIVFWCQETMGRRLLHCFLALISLTAVYILHFLVVSQRIVNRVEPAHNDGTYHYNISPPRWNLPSGPFNDSLQTY